MRSGSYIVASSIALALAGCGGSTATVGGEVTYEGKPIKAGYISFAPADGKGPVAAGPIRDGRYSIANMQPGSKIVKIEAAGDAGPSIQSTADMEKYTKEMKGKIGPSGIISTDIVPPNAVGNNITLEVKPGDNMHDFPLKKPAP